MLLQARQAVLLGLRDASLAATVCSAAEGLAKKAPLRQGVEERCYVAAAGLARGQDANASLLGCLTPTVRLALWGLRPAAVHAGIRAEATCRLLSRRPREGASVDTQPALAILHAQLKHARLDDKQ